MITNAILDAAVLMLQPKFDGAGSTVEVIAGFPDVDYEPPDHPLLYLHEGDEYDVVLSQGMRGNPTPPAYQPQSDILYADYRMPSANDRGSTFAQSQRDMRDDKMLFATFWPVGEKLGDTVLEAGRVLHFKSGLLGPMDQQTQTASARYAWRCEVSVRTSNHTAE